jgi:glycerol-1-phosphate dehydrogenase [NAD(P)+]
MTPNLNEVLERAPETKCLELGAGALTKIPSVFRTHFPAAVPLVVADPVTFSVAGETTANLLKQAGWSEVGSFLFCEPGFYAEHRFVEQLEARLNARKDTIPIAVGSGTINDVTKLAAHRTARRYLTVATAASMDGYTAFGASITRQGSKQTFACPAPLAVIADTNVIAGAPLAMNAAGYADLAAKVTAGADWLLADALGVEPLHETAWRLVQGKLPIALRDPGGIQRSQGDVLQQLTEGLLYSGFAMQFAASSRPASGAEHQFSHLWDMQHHTFRGIAPLHGHKVGVATLAVTALYEYLLTQPLENLDLEHCCRRWPELSALEQAIGILFPNEQLAAVALTECRAKHVEKTELHRQLARLRTTWPSLRDRLHQQLLPFARLKQMLRDAGAPDRPEKIGLSREHLRRSFSLAYHIRRRFTVLDLVVRADLLEGALNHLFGPDGPWPSS